jgi:hypothetical protein
MKFRYKYEYTNDFGYPKHVWTCIGRRGAMHFHVTDMGEKGPDGERRSDRYSGGLEVHYREPPDYMGEQVPSTDKCWLIGCPCWHDGTSLYAQEFLIPFWLANPTDHDRMFKCLAHEYEQRFEPKAEAA